MTDKEPWEKHGDGIADESRTSWLQEIREQKRAVFLGICIGWALLALMAITHPVTLMLTEGLPQTSKTTYTVGSIVDMAVTGFIPLLMFVVLETLVPEVLTDGR